LVAAQPLKLPKPLERDPITLPASLFAQWERQWGQQIGRFELEDGKGRAWTAAERAAGADGARKLTQDEPYPQSLYYRAGAKAGEPVLVTIPLRYASTDAKSKQARLVRWCWQIILNSQLSLLNSWQEDAYQAGCSLQKN
jgi:hypothetical protein